MTDFIIKAMQRTWSLGQKYWQDADSESYAANKRSADTHAKYIALLDEVRAALSAPAAPSVPRERFDALLAQEHALSDAYVRLRQIIGAMDPPTVSDAPALWAYVEQVARERMAAAP